MATARIASGASATNSAAYARSAVIAAAADELIARTVPAPIVLAKVPSNAPAATFLPYLGDYIYLTASRSTFRSADCARHACGAVGSNFYGVFSANNTHVPILL
jgi:hypothetical protein